MIRGAFILALQAVLWTRAATAQPYPIMKGPIFDVAFTPEKNFKGDLVENSDDQLLLTAVYAMRDGTYPVYSLAVAHTVRCRAVDGTSKCFNHYPIRIVRVAGSTDPERSFSSSRALMSRLGRAGVANSASVRRGLRKGDLEWLEADLIACTGAFEKLDAVRRANWAPDLHHKFVDTSAGEDTEVYLHPAMMKISMSGLRVTSRYAGHIFRELPQSVDAFVESLGSRWKLARSRPPWRR